MNAAHASRSMHPCIQIHEYVSFASAQQKRTCKIVQESCKNLACKTCLARARDMSLFLHDSCTILHQFLQDLVKKCARNAFLQQLLQNLAPFLARYVRLCKNRARNVQEKGHVACTCQASLACKILARFLHNLA